MIQLNEDEKQLGLLLNQNQNPLNENNYGHACAVCVVKGLVESFVYIEIQHTILLMFCFTCRSYLHLFHSQSLFYFLIFSKSKRFVDSFCRKS